MIIPNPSPKSRGFWPFIRSSSPARTNAGRSEQIIPSPPKATITLEVDGKSITREASGDGPVDSIFKAIKAAVPHEARLPLYQVMAVTEGTDAQAEVTVRLEEGGKTVNGQGAETDSILASARAYVAALNKLLVKREKTAPAALSA